MQTFAPSYRTHATSEPGRVVALAEDRKVDKIYRDLPRSHLFCPLSIEAMGPSSEGAGWQEDRNGDRGAIVY